MPTDEIIPFPGPVQTEDTRPKSHFAHFIGPLSTLKDFAILAYALGFFIEGYFDAKHGLTYLDPLRSRIILTGASFLIQLFLAVLGIWALERSFPRLTAWDEDINGTSGWRKRLYRVAKFAAYIVEGSLLGLVIATFLTPRVANNLETSFNAASQSSGAVADKTQSFLQSLNLGYFQLFVALATIALLASFQLNKQPEKKSRFDLTLIAAVSSILGPLGLLAILVKLELFTLINFVLYGTLIAISYHAFLAWSRNTLRERILLIACAVLLPLLYSQMVYEDISSVYGGAAKAELWVQFDEDLVPYGKDSDAYLLEETSDGYYLLLKNYEAVQKSCLEKNKEEQSSSTNAESVDTAADQQISSMHMCPFLAVSDPSDDRRLRDIVIFIPRKKVKQVFYAKPLTRTN